MPSGNGFSLDQASYISLMKPINIDKDRYPCEDSNCTELEKHQFTSLVCALLWIVQTRLDAIADVCQLQSKVTTCTVKDMKTANNVLKRIKRDAEQFRLWYPPLEDPYRIVSVSDASHATKSTSYAHEGQLIMLMSDITPRVDKNGFIPLEDSWKIGGYCHVIASSGHKSKRISNSTSHAETLSCVTSSLTAQMIALRITEILYGSWLKGSSRLNTLLEWQDQGLFILPVWLITDCKDLLELVTGHRGVPSDKSQRLSILALREDRLSGRVSAMLHINTHAMLADGLTKGGTFPLLMEFMTTGYWQGKTTADKLIVMRVIAPRKIFDESDLVNMKQ